MDNLSHGFAYSSDNRQHLQPDSSSQDDLNPSLLQHGVPYSHLMASMSLAPPDAISFSGANQFASSRFPLGFSQNLSPQGFPLMSQSPLCQNLEMDMSPRQPRPSQSLRHQPHSQTHPGFSLDMSPVTGPPFSPPPPESSRRHTADHLPSFNSIVSPAPTGLSSMDLQRSYNDSHKQQLLSPSHEMGTPSGRNSLAPETQPFQPLQSYQHQENMSESRTSHLSPRDTGHCLDMAKQKSMESRGHFDVYQSVHSDHRQAGDAGMNGRVASPPTPPMKQHMTRQMSYSDSSSTHDNRTMEKHMQNASRERAMQMNMLEKPLVGSSPETDHLNRSGSISPQTRFLNKFSPSCAKRQNNDKGAIKFILAGQLENSLSSKDSDANKTVVYSQEQIDKETRSIAIQTGSENAMKTIKREHERWSASACDGSAQKDKNSVNSYHPRSMVPNPDPAAKRERLQMAYDNPRQLLSPSFNTGGFRMGRSNRTENGIGTNNAGSHENSESHEGGQNFLPQRFSTPRAEGFTRTERFNSTDQNESFPRKDISDETDAEQREAIFQATKEKLDMERMEVNIQIDESQCILINDQKRWQCHLCSKNYTTKHNLVTHILDHNGIKPHLCRVCGKYFKQLSHLNTHMLTHDNVKPHVCTICSKGFTQVSHLKRHQAVHLGDNKPYKCDICGRGFAYPSELRVHKERHVPGRDKCLDCGEEFGSPRLLKQHQATHEDRENLTCSDCGRGFRYPSQLRDHMMTHSGTRPHICSECGMDFMKEHHLRAHMFTHSGLRPFTCKECGRSFNQKANLQRHQLIHSAERAFKCELCEKTFTQPQTLKAHMVVHADKKPYQCSLCGKEFGRLHNLQGHMHMHNDSKPYVCFCGSSFTLKGNLNRHKKVKHGLDESTESMEEEAVNFLSSMERAREDREDDYLDMEDRCDGDPNDSMLDDSLQDDSKLSRKQRKSKPRKVLQTSETGDGEAAGGNQQQQDAAAGGENSQPADSEEQQWEQDQEQEQEQEQEEEENTESSTIAKRGLESAFGSDNDDEYSGLQVKFRQSARQVSSRLLQEYKDEVDSCPSDSEMGNDDGTDNDWVPSNPRKSRKLSKGAKLDSIIQEKFMKE